MLPHNPSSYKASRTLTALQQTNSAPTWLTREQVEMTHAMLPPALQRLTTHHWEEIGNEVIEKARYGALLHSVISNLFHNKIYITSSSAINYTFSKPKDDCRREWRQVIAHAQKNPKWKPEGIHYGQCGAVQIDGVSDDDIMMARLYLRYYRSSANSRLQFVVTSQAGPFLYLALAQAMDSFINQECDSNPKSSPVISFKVFSEEAQVGRPDSAIIYLNTLPADVQVKKLVTYLDNALGKQLAQISVVGATTIGNKCIQAYTIPDHNLQKQTFGNATASLGAFMTKLLAKAYVKAYQDRLLIDQNPFNIKVTMLNQHAQFYAKEIWSKLELL